MAAKLDLLGQQRSAGAAIILALVRIAKAAGFREFSGGFQGGTGHGITSCRQINAVT
jgi:hypothetical protein